MNDGDSFSDTATNVSGSVSSRLSRMSQPVEGDDDDFADAIAPLRTTADRVSLQIDLFAKAVAKFKEQSSKGDRKATLDCAINLIRGFQKIADSMASPSRGNDALKKARSMVGAANPSTIDENVIRAKLESDTWDLFSQLLVVDNMELDPELLRQMKEEPLGELHRFSSEYDIWKRFLEIDIFSASTATVMRWLEKTSRSLVHAAIDTTIADLEAKAGMNSGGIWTQGWLASREKVKGGKRLYGRTTLLEPDDVALRPQLNTGKYVETITHLDPDAAIRQDRPLMERDQYLEQASWLTIWKMLRQGRSWPEIKDWASERLEYWRAVSICGSSVGCGSDDVDPFDESFTRMMNCDSLDVWRSACRSLANRPTDEFERAVYALLCGETEPAYKACQGWSDYLYVYLNSLLISRYRDFYSQHQQFIDYPKDQPFHFYLKEPYYEKLRTYIDSLKTNDKFKAEARNPYRTVQSAVISRPYDEFFQRQSNALSKVAASSKGRTLVPRFYDSDVDDGAFVTAQDESGIRMICHFYIITKGLNQVTNSEQVTEHASVNIIGYINLLQRMKKLEHIPLYASLLHEATCYNVLGRVLVYVTDEKQRLSLIRAVEKQGLDMAKVLDSQWQYLVSETLEQDGFLKPIQIKRTVVRPKDDLPPKIISSKNNFINKHVRKDSEALIKSLEWHSYVKGTWNKVCVFGKFLYKRFFSKLVSFILCSAYLKYVVCAQSQYTDSTQAAGRLTEARLLHERVPLTRLSLDILGRDITSSLEYLEFTNEEGDATPTQERPETHLTQRQLEYLQSQTMRDLEMLIEVFEALDEWNALVEKLEKYVQHLYPYSTPQNSF